MRIPTPTVVLVLSAACAGSSAPASPPAGEPAASIENVTSVEPVDLPSPMQMRARSDMNMHTSFGAQGSDSSSRVLITFVSELDVQLRDEGKRSEYVMDNQRGTRKDETAWANVWAGTWTARDTQMTLVLELSERACTEVVTYYNGAEASGPCRATEPLATIECTVETVDVENAPGTDVWRCHSNNSNMGGTSSPWVFAREGCLERSGGGKFSGGMTYRPCEDGSQ